MGAGFRRATARSRFRLKPAPIYLAVHRMDFSVYFRRLEREEFLLLRAFTSGKSLDSAIALAFRKSAIPIAERPANIQQWFHNWAALGWFCRTEQKPAGT